MRKMMFRWLIALAIVLPCLLLTAAATEQSVPEEEDVLQCTGFIFANQATGESYTVIGTEYYVVCLNIETGMDMLGHYVTAYYAEEYKSEREPGVAYSVVDKGIYVTLEEDIVNDRAAFRAAFGVYSVNVAVEDMAVFNERGKLDSAYALTFDPSSYTAAAGTYVLNSEDGMLIGHLAPIAAEVGVVNKVFSVPLKEGIKVNTRMYSNNIYEDVVVEYDGIAVDDIVVKKQYGDMTYLDQPQIITGKITKVETRDGIEYTYIDDVEYANGSLPGADEAGLITNYDPDENSTYNCYIYDGKLIGAIETANVPVAEDAIYVVGAYQVPVTGNYGNTTNYYAQGVDAAGKEVSVLIGVGDLGVTALADGFYTFETSPDKEEAEKDIMVATAAETAYSFDEDVDKFFQADVTCTISRDILTKDDKYVFIGDEMTTANRLYLSDDTRYILVDDSSIGGPLAIATYTGGINKNVYGDTLAAAVTVDEWGNCIADTIVIVTRDMAQKAEDYIFVVDGDDFSAVEDGKEYTVYFTSTNEFKTIITDTTYATGFYGDYTIDEDGIYDLGALEAYEAIKADQFFASVFGESLISTEVHDTENNTFVTGDIDLYDAANAVIVDVRGEDVIEKSEVAEIETLDDIKAAHKAGYKVKFIAIVDTSDADEPVVTHIFVTEIPEENTSGEGEAIYNISVEMVSNGTISVDRTVAAKNAIVTVTAVPEEGYRLESILVDGVAISGKRFAVTGDHVVKAVFVLDTTPSVDDTVYVVDTYDVSVAGNYGTTTNYYAQGVNAEGKEVSILIGVGDLGATTLADGFYVFETSPDKEEAEKDIMVATAAETAYSFDQDVDKFFAADVTHTITSDILTKDDRFVFIGETKTNANRVYLSDNTRYILVDDSSIGGPLAIATYTGGINKNVYGDTLAAAVTVDEWGNCIADTIVIVTRDMAQKAEDYIFVVDGADYSVVGNGNYEYTVYFTSINEFKAIIADTIYETGFYGDYTIDEDGIYDLGALEVYDDIKADQFFAGVFGETLISSDVYDTENNTFVTGDIDLYDAANAKVVDLRPTGEEYGARFENLDDIKVAHKADRKVKFIAIVDTSDADEPVVTHIFVTFLGELWEDEWGDQWFEECSFNKPVSVNYYNISLGEVTNGKVYVSRKIAPEGYTVIVSALPDTGYMVESILVDGVAIDGDRFAAAGNHVVAATFAPIPGLNEETKVVTGFITANQETTGEPYTEVGGVKLNLETGADMLGHYVIAYYDEAYKNAYKPGVAHTVVEMADYVVVEESIDTRKAFEEAFGAFNVVKNESVTLIDSRGYLTTEAEMAWVFDCWACVADAGIYVVDKESGRVIGYIAPIGVSVGVVTDISTEVNNESITIDSDKVLENSEYWDEVVEYDGIAEDDIVIVKQYQDMIHLEKPQVITGQLTKLGVTDGRSYAYINGVGYPAAGMAINTVPGMISPESLYPDYDRAYEFYIYDGKLLGVREIPQSVDAVVYVVDSYCVEVAGNYGYITNYYAQGVDAEGKEVSVLIGVGDLGATTLADGFYTFETSANREEAKKDIMVATAVKDAAVFDEDVDSFFAVSGDVVPQGGNALTSQDEYLNTDDGVLYLTNDTRFVIIKRNVVVDRLEIVTRTGTIDKRVDEGDTFAVVATMDEQGNRLANTVVIVAANLELKSSGYIYVVDGNEYSRVEGGYEYEVFVSAINEFKHIVTDAVYPAGFYGDYTIDEDGVYDLGLVFESGDLVKYNQELVGVIGTSINATDIELCEASDASILDIRPEDVLEDAEVAVIETLSDIKAALKGGYGVYFDALLEQQGDEHVVTHIFVREVTEPEPELYTISVGAVSGGKVSVNWTDAYYGEVVVVYAIPDEGYVLKQILVDGKAIEGNSFTATGDHVVTAVFEKKQAQEQSGIRGYFSLEVVNTIIVNGEEVDICRWVWTPLEGK